MVIHRTTILPQLEGENGRNGQRGIPVTLAVADAPVGRLDGGGVCQVVHGVQQFDQLDGGSGAIL
uniref:hypothetical protein n=1 Tax=Enterocloster clostridioformis TaxID=1531 RepID=UPI0025A57E06|nr:hypothetical protein [Enterocloster clostridioformis]